MIFLSPVACWNSVYRKIFHYKPWTFVQELIYYLDRINIEHLFFQKKLCFLHSLLSCNNDVVSSVMDIFMQNDEYIKAYNFEVVQPCDSKTKIRHCIKEKYADSIY